MKKVLTVVGAAAVGFVAGILTAPKSGKETRADIKKKAGEVGSVAARKAQDAKLIAEDSVESLKTGAQKIGGVVAKTAREVKTSAQKRAK